MWRGCRWGEAGDGKEDTEVDCSAAPGGQSTGLGITRAGLSTKRCRKLATWTVCLVIIYCHPNHPGDLHGEVLELLHCSTRANWWSADTQLSGWNHFHGRRPDPGPGGTTVELPIVRTHLASFLNRNNEPQN